MTKVAVFGAGSRGTAFAKVLAEAGNEVSVWGRREVICETINSRHSNPDYLPGILLPESITATHDPVAAVDGAEAVVLAVPSQSLRENLAEWAAILPDTPPLVSLMKGVEVGTTKRMSEVITELTGAGPERIAVVSGPNLSREIAEGQPAASVVACADEGTATRLQKLCHSPSFRPYTTTDVIGCELGGATKNVIALAVGMAVGLGFGDNARASVITRGLAETARQVAEGVASAASIAQLARNHDVEMPIVEHVTQVVAGELTPKEMLISLISRSAKAERWG